MFTEKAQTIVDLAKDYAYSAGSAELGITPFLQAIGSQTEALVLLAEAAGLELEKLRERIPPAPEPASCPGKLPLAEVTRLMLGVAKELADETPDRFHPGLIDLRHLVIALASCREFCALLNVTPFAREDAAKVLAGWYDRQAQSPALNDLMERLRRLRVELLAKVFGQDHAIHAFVEGIFSAEVVASADVKRKAPRALFVFAGPPGVGKTFLAESAAGWLERPFMRFDMSTYSDHQASNELVGFAKSYQAARPGTLTGFVEKHPDAVLLFDEVEKAHLNTIQLFLQILDAGVLFDKYHERNVAFRNTTIIFTTNAGRKLYERPNESGVHQANASFHRKTILDALENEKDPRTGQPFFPAAICSRMATGYPILFNHLRITELERVTRAELLRTAGLFERQYFKRTMFHELLPMCLVLREGAKVDARTLRSQAETFFKTEVFKFCQLFKTDRIEEVMKSVNELSFMVEGDRESLATEIKALFEQQEKPRVLLVAGEQLAALYRETVPDVEWRIASAVPAAMDALANEEVDMVLVDLWMGAPAKPARAADQHFDHTPLTAHGLDQGQELLRKIHERLPHLPVYLLSLGGPDGDPEGAGTIDDELFMACVRGGGARGMVTSRFIDGDAKGWEAARDDFAARLAETCGRLYREKAAERLGQERKALSFDTVPKVDAEQRTISIRLCNLNLTRAIAAADAGEILDDVERPKARFDDVIGADTAKDELKFFIDYLKNPRRFAALGLKPPKGVLLHGPPGTGKTMLARAMAGESNVAFMPVSAANFVTIWQGSGPQSIRDIFARARRYAPAIVFIDEIDAIGKVRTGLPSSHAEEMALNALLTEMDGFTGPSPDRPVFVLSATNFKVEAEDQAAPEKSTRTLDPALVRRFARTILVDLPDTAARRKYLTLRLAEAKGAKISESVINLMAEKSTGMSIANLEQVLEMAGRTALKKGVEITDDLIVEVLDTVREGEAKEWSPEFLESTARHEAGHTLMYWLGGWWSPEVSIVARADHGGGMRRSEEEIKRESLKRDEMLARIRVSLGGRAAEMLYYGEAGLTTGASGDLENATGVARQMICRYGMDEEFGLLATPELFKYAEAISSPAYQRVNEAAAKILKEQMAKTKKLLEENRQHLDAVAKALLAKNRLYRKDLEEILPAIPDRPAQH
jgi:cell division protease FtsH